MLRTALTSLFCSLLLAASSYSQDVFVPRELKAQAAHPPAVKEHAAEAKTPKTSKEVVRRAEPVTDADLKAPTAKTEKSSPKEKAPVTAKVEKKDEAAGKTLAKSDLAKAELSKEKTEKPAASKDKSAAATVKVEKTTPAKEEPTSKALAKTESAKVETVTAKREKPPVKEKPASVAAAKTQKEEKTPPAKEEPAVKTVAKSDSAKIEKPAAVKEKEKSASVVTAKAQPAKEEPAPKAVAKSDSVKEKPASVTSKMPAAKPEALIAKVETPRPPAEGPITVSKTTTVKAEQVSVPTMKDPPQIMPAATGPLETGFTKIADGFDFPVGKPEAEGYYKARGFRQGGHVGEDWDGTRGGDTDLRDPIYSIGDGIVVFARDVHLGWGNVIIVRHAYRENGTVKYVDALYGHLNTMLVGRGQKVSRGQQIATMGNAHGQYDAHLHFEIRKNLEIGMSRSKFQKDFSNYYDPSQFVASHRHLAGGGANYKVAMNTFTHDWMFHFDSNRNFSARKRGTGESSAALRRALTSTR